MEAVANFFESVAIFKSLGIDHTLIYQFVLFFILFIILKPLVLTKLQYVIELRKSKTTGLIEEAERNMNKANELVDKYNKAINGAYSESQKIVSDEKKKKIDEGREVLKAFEINLEKDADVKIKQAKGEADIKEIELNKNVDQLADDLVSTLKN